MDDRKRVLPVKSEVDAPPSKRQATDTNISPASSNGHSLPLTQEDVVNFQKEAIFRQMQVYRRERDQLQNRINEVEQRSAYHDDHIRLLEGWWDQLLNEINILFAKPVNDSSDNIVPKSLLLSNHEEYSQHLTSKRNLILQTLTPIFASMQPATPEAMDVKNLQSQLSDFAAQISVVKIENERLKDEREDLEQRLTAATFKFMSAEKKMDRLKSSTLAKIERTTAPVQVKKEEPVEEKAEAEKKPSAEIDEEMIKKIKQESDAIIQKQSEEMKALHAKVLSLQDELAKLDLKFSKLTEADVSNCEPYKNLKLRYIDLSSRANHLESLNEIIKQEK
ncbi:hypothetical protein BZA70DRAFT_131099 [Myxozyma melibiosi]|uniref:E3 ubiquitin protein ligase n=1 Tax=Myxozyma melibiosi TaxID=54550 RepID=A0ABR1F914_9ASCO